jgi:hypothetical protein
MPTPRDLDPKFRKDGDGRTTDETYIVHRVPFVDSAGNAGVKVHGPMPISEWAAYSKENGL